MNKSMTVERFLLVSNTPRAGILFGRCTEGFVHWGRAEDATLHETREEALRWIGPGEAIVFSLSIKIGWGNSCRPPEEIYVAEVAPRLHDILLYELTDPTYIQGLLDINDRPDEAA